MPLLIEIEGFSEYSLHHFYPKLGVTVPDSEVETLIKTMVAKGNGSFSMFSKIPKFKKDSKMDVLAQKILNKNAFDLHIFSEPITLTTSESDIFLNLLYDAGLTDSDITRNMFMRFQDWKNPEFVKFNPYVKIKKI